LKEKGLAFDVRVVDSTKDETRAPEYLAKTVTGRVPALFDGDFGIAESSAIVEYLEEAYPETPVLPRAPHDRARCRQLMSWLRSDETLILREERPTTTIFYAPAKTPLSPLAAAAASKLCDVASRVVQTGEGSLFGAWSIVDAELAFMLHRLIASGDPVPPAVREWAARQWNRPTVQSFVSHERPNGT
jgi:glutathione S-transferase